MMLRGLSCSNLLPFVLVVPIFVLAAAPIGRLCSCRCMYSALFRANVQIWCFIQIPQINGTIFAIGQVFGRLFDKVWGSLKHFQAHRNYTKCLQYMEFRTILCRARKTAFIYLLNNLMYRLFKAILFLSLATFCSSCMHNFGHEVHAAWIRGKVVPTRNPKPIWGLKTPKKNSNIKPHSNRESW